MNGVTLLEGIFDTIIKTQYLSHNYANVAKSTYPDIISIALFLSVFFFFQVTI